VAAGEALLRHLDALGVATPALRWLSADELAGVSATWAWQAAWLERCEAVRRSVRTAAEREDRLDAFNCAADFAAEIAADPSRAAAEPRADEAEQRQAASGAAIYTAGLAAGWCVVADVVSGADPFAPLLEVFEHGHWPLGPVADAFVLA
jgi:hypothetical protein